MALRATIYLSIMGKTGLPTLAQICYEKAHYLADGLLKLKGYSLPYGRNFLKEFVIKTPISAKKIKNEALKNGLLLNTPEHDLTDSLLLIAVTEKRTKNELDNLITELKKYS
jgi:glycine dehydrogenase subunit 1